MKIWIVEDAHSGVVYLVKADYPDDAENKVRALVDMAAAYAEFCESWNWTQNQIQELRADYTPELPPTLEEFTKDYQIEARGEFVLKEDVVPIEDLLGDFI
ncbi:MAG: hypothetical protein M0R80_08090 [Proteobacteria bacterium]|jgi:hypothetical protein|nr:hypothetical protein [Pseudomonadota bacterium]